MLGMIGAMTPASDEPHGPADAGSGAVAFVSSAGSWTGTMWGLAPGAGGRSATEREPTAACAPALPGVTACSVVLPREKTQSAQRTQAGPAPAVLAPRQILAVRLLMMGMGVTEAARQVGVCRHTIRRWMKAPAFHAEARRQAAALPVPRKHPPRL
jgi:hypothetical protein